jgi:hypothetical protein
MRRVFLRRFVHARSMEIDAARRDQLHVTAAPCPHGPDARPQSGIIIKAGRFLSRGVRARKTAFDGIKKTPLLHRRTRPAPRDPAFPRTAAIPGR